MFLGSFVFNQDFDYLKYLEEKSHFDRLQVASNRQIRDLISSSRKNIEVLSAHQDEMTSRLGELNTTIETGFDRVCLHLDDVKDSIDDLSAVCVEGFHQIDIQLARMNETLEELLVVAKSPEKTWADEQFDYARRAYLGELFSEALEYINLALGGDANNRGFKLEPAYHMLRGFIHRGSDRNSSPQIVNLSIAKESFLEAARVGRSLQHDADRAMGSGFLQAGWIDVLTGDRSEARKNFGLALRHMPDSPEAMYGVAKVSFADGQIDEGKVLLGEVLRSSPNYGMRVSADPDFLAHHAVVVYVINDIRREVWEPISGFMRSVANDMAFMASQPQLSGFVDGVKKLGSGIEDLALEDLGDRLSTFPKAAQELASQTEAQISSRSAGVQNKSESLWEYMGPLFGAITMTGGFLGLVAGVGLAIWEGVGQWTGDLASVIVVPIMTIIMVVLYGVLGPLIGAGIGLVISLLLMFLGLSKVASEKSSVKFANDELRGRLDRIQNALKKLLEGLPTWKVKPDTRPQGGLIRPASQRMR